MSNQWVIEILAAGQGGVAFQPLVPNAKTGDPLVARANDLVIWSNRTDLDLTLQSTDPAGLDLDQQIGAGETSSSPFLLPPDGPSRIEYASIDPPQAHEIDIITETDPALM